MLTFITELDRCDAARHSGPSPQLQNHTALGRLMQKAGSDWMSLQAKDFSHFCMTIRHESPRINCPPGSDSLAFDYSMRV
ncbi:hypothetical protein [Rhodovulum viride]|uniref:hypothetical protein n=1 Tax=Rhodovulum viride TaxID=1231134 RepID=UPI0015ECD321|nr:hypothetical protein [Rhodovulum viride]